MKKLLTICHNCNTIIINDDYCIIGSSVFCSGCFLEYQKDLEDLDEQSFYKDNSREDTKE